MWTVQAWLQQLSVLLLALMALLEVLMLALVVVVPIKDWIGRAWM